MFHRRFLRLSLALNTTPHFWMGLQSEYDLDVAMDEKGIRYEKEIQSVLA